MAYDLPAGMRNNNPGNIKFIGQPGTTPSVNTDQGDPQAVYATPEAGMRAMYELLLRKYSGGKVTPAQMIAAQGGWTPGNTQAAQNVATNMGIGVNDDINLYDPAAARKFMRALMKQEHGEASNAYTDLQIDTAIQSGGQVAPTAGAATTSTSGVTPTYGQTQSVATPAPISLAPVLSAATEPAENPVQLVEKDSDNPWTSLSGGLASSVRPAGATQMAGGGFGGAGGPSGVPEFESASPALPGPVAVGLPGAASGQPLSQLADLFKVDPSRFGQAALLNLDTTGQPIRRRQYG